MSRLQGQVALITGGSRGIGAATARLMAQEGATVVVNYWRSEGAAVSLVKEIIEAHGEACVWQADVSDAAQVQAMANGVLERFGKIDILVSNAGINSDHLAAGLAVEEWDAVVAVNLRGAFLVVREVLPHMVSQRTGAIVHVASTHALAAGAGHCHYAASKAGLVALTRVLALEVAARGVRVNAVAPGMIETDMTRALRENAGERVLKEIPMRRFGLPAEVARAVVFLASAEASYITGVTLPISGGLGL